MSIKIFIEESFLCITERRKYFHLLRVSLHIFLSQLIYFSLSYIYIRSVQSLKQAIERHHAIPACSQVLLVSGGETLESNSRVCNYAAGTDSNPIFMFSNSLEPRNPAQPWPSIENGE